MKDFDVEAVSHGRVNLIGEHTDYNGGFVLPTCIPQKTTVRLKRRGDGRVECRSANFEGSFNYALGEEKVSKRWYDFIQGVTRILANDGRKIGGFDAWIESTVPIGSGLSSSAALEVALLKALNEMYGLDLSPVRIAELGQKVENEFVGARVGIMDQMVTSLGTLGEALFIDTRDLSFKRLPLPLSEIELVVINSGVAHSNAHGGYNQRRAECEKACELLGVKSLRDLGPADLGKLDALPSPIKERARHVITENQRVLDAVAALERRDYEALGRLFVKSHESMRDDYAVSVPEVDRLVELCLKESGVFGARLTGGGFGGSIVALVKKGRGAPVAAEVAKQYGHKATVLVP